MWLLALAWVCHIRDTQSLDTWETVQRYVRCHIFCLLETTLFADKSTAYAHTKYLPLFQNFEQIGTYSWRSATLTHLYRSLCRASRYDCKEMDDPIDLLFERMPFLAPIPRQQFALADILVACRWSHHPRTRAWMSRSAMSIRHDIDYMDEFVLRPYISIIIPTKLHAHLDVCDTVRLLLSFECVEWNSADRLVPWIILDVPEVVIVHSSAATPPAIPLATPQTSTTLCIISVISLSSPTTISVITASTTACIMASTIITAQITASSCIIAPIMANRAITACIIARTTPSRAILDSSSQTFSHFHHSGDPLEKDLIPTVPSQQSSHSHRASVDNSSRRSHRTPTPDSRASGCIDSYLEIDRGRLNVPTQASSGLDLNAPTQEVVDEYIPDPYASAEAGGSCSVEGQAEADGSGPIEGQAKAGGSGLVEGHVVGHQYNLRTDVRPPNRFTPSNVDKIANKGMEYLRSH
ncbi:hypothetical protein Ahy_B06g080384 [Arachis hypogaea]|uniref:Aminotransferase-like plant mobile domain-containing protein n=1 Tax=Arachis hypogaea TaxID=3818 RepID=A0A444YHX9_ARAHY|nr:hypothetical protein Ahy_B06g080384 [Arachis hypogaea]